jgi:PAS domain S-box-containing protein
MSNTKQIRHLTPELRETLVTMLEALPDALFVVDNIDTIVYANRCAQAMLGTTPEALHGHCFWRSATPLVSPALYQAMRQTREVQEPMDVESRSAVARNWLRVHLTPTVGGLLLQFHQASAPAQRPETVPLGECLPIEDLDSLQSRIAILTPEGIVLDINQVSFNEAQIRREEVIGKPLAEAPWYSFSPASQEQLRAAIARASMGETVQFETLLHPRKGRVLSFEGVITPHLDADHRVVYLVTAGIDITARKRAEEAIHTLINAIPQLVWIARPDGYVTYINQRLSKYLAMTQEQTKGAGWLAGGHPEDRQRAREAWQTSIQTGQPYEVEHRIRDGISGAYRWFLVRGVPQRNAHGTILHWMGTCTDIEEQKRTEQQLKESEERFRVLAETVPQLVWIERADGYVEYLNQRYIDYFQARPEQLQSYGWSHFLHADDAQRTLAVWHHACDSGEPYEIEYRLKEGQTGAYRWFLGRALPVRDEAGQILKWFGTCTDIEKQKRTEAALRQSQERVNALMNSNIVGIFVGEGEQIVDANDTFLRMTGYTREDLNAGRMNWLHMTPPEYLAQTLKAQQELTARQSTTPYEKEYVCQDGSRLPVLMGSVLLQHHPFQVINFVLDNSARKELEQRKDDFISMASHELRNPLTALKLQMALLHRQLAKQGTLDQVPALSSMETQINKVNRLVEELLDVSKIQAGRLEYVQETTDLDALLREITDALQQTSPSHTLVVRGTVGANLVGDRDRLGQVFTNLISNAIKYSPNAKTVEIDLSTSEDVVTVRVRDHGVGISREQRDKIFERFYRVTDPKQKAIPGLGMGLYIVAEIVKGHEGSITVDSEVGTGSTFTVTLPRRRRNA